jgi:hypothetical protein
MNTKINEKKPQKHLILCRLMEDVTFCVHFNTYTLEKTERAVKNGQSRETGNIEYTRHRQKQKHTTQKTNHDEQHVIWMD